MSVAPVEPVYDAAHLGRFELFTPRLEPGGNRVELITDGRLILAPVWPGITWTLEERLRGQAWLTHMPESWFEYATPLPPDS